jgi:hypothetical protein
MVDIVRKPRGRAASHGFPFGMHMNDSRATSGLAGTPATMMALGRHVHGAKSLLGAAASLRFISTPPPFIHV